MTNQICEFLQRGRVKDVKRLVEEALEAGIDPKEILNDGLIEGMSIVGMQFKENEIFVPEVLVAARAMTAGLSVLEPKLIEVGNEPIGKAVIGTVRGDLHDIGKNLVAVMLKGAGFEVIDLGTDVDADTFVDKAEELDVDIIAMSALLTTTMPEMKSVIEVLEERGLRDKYTVMVGGAPVTENYAEKIGADYFTMDAGSAAEVAKRVVKEKTAYLKV